MTDLGQRCRAGVTAQKSHQSPRSKERTLPSIAFATRNRSRTAATSPSSSMSTKDQREETLDLHGLEWSGSEANHPNQSPESAAALSWVHPLFFTAALLACAIFLFRQTSPPDLFEHSDKFAHAGGFFALVLLGYRATSRNSIPFPIVEDTASGVLLRPVECLPQTCF